MRSFYRFCWETCALGFAIGALGMFGARYLHRWGCRW